MIGEVWRRNAWIDFDDDTSSF